MSNYSTQPPASPAASGSSPRLFVLLGLLIVALGALAYDYLIARPGSDRGYDEVMKLAEQRTSSGFGKDEIGPAQVQAKLGKKPANTENNDRYTIETYNWRRGSLFQNYYVKVIYIGFKKPVLYTALKNELPDDDNLPMNKILSADEADVKPSTGPVGIGPAGGPPSRPPSTNAPRPSKDAKPSADVDSNQPKATDPPAADQPAANKPDADKPTAEKSKPPGAATSP